MSLIATLKKTFAEDFFRIFSLLSKTLQLRAVMVFALMFAQSLLELAFIWALTRMGLALTDSVSLRGTMLYQGMFYLSPELEAWTMDSRRLLILAGGVVIIFSAIKSLVSFLTGRSMALLSEDVSLAVGEEIMYRFLYRDYAWHLSPASATMYQRMVWRSQLSCMLESSLLLYSTVLTVVVLFGSLVGREPLLTSLVVLMTVSMGCLLFRFMRKRVDSYAKLSAASAQEETKALLCATKGIREVLIYRQQPTFLKALMQAAEKGRYARAFSSLAPTMPTWVLEAVGFAAVILAIAFLVFVQNASIERVSAALALLVLTAWRVLPYCNRIVGLQLTVRNSRPKASAVIDLLEELRSMPPLHLPIPDPQFKFEKSVALENIYFRYAGASKDSLKKISLCINKGERVGLIGASGGGKSTLAGVLSGLLPAQEGSILVDGMPLTPARSAALAAQIGYVPQNPFLFAGSLAENVAFSEWGKTWDAEKVKVACRKAAIDFIQAHPAGIERKIGENGAGLSGGQAQRVSIARAMYNNPSLLIFDEATSALDQYNEAAIQETIESLSNSVTCLIIAHRLSTVEKCDRLIWMDNGEVVMNGSAKDVLREYLKKRTQEGN